MTRTILFGAGALALALTGCATTGERPGPGNRDSCKTEPGKRFIGQKATAESGGRIMIATGAKRLRWVPPRTAVTMEYAFGRVTVSYDDDYTITQVACG